MGSVSLFSAQNIDRWYEQLDIIVFNALIRKVDPNAETVKFVVYWGEKINPSGWGLLQGNLHISEKTFSRWADEGRTVDFNLILMNHDISKQTLKNGCYVFTNPNISRETFLK